MDIDLDHRRDVGPQSDVNAPSCRVSVVLSIFECGV